MPLVGARRGLSSLVYFALFRGFVPTRGAVRHRGQGGASDPRSARGVSMFGWFESRLAPFPDDGLTEPPRSLVAFCRHFTRGVWPAIAVMAVLTSTIAVAEVSLYAFLGHIVDWLSERPRETLFAEEGTKLLGMGAVVLLVLPLV